MGAAGRILGEIPGSFDPRQAIERTILELAELQHWVVSLEQLLALGLSHDTVRRRVLERRLHRIHAGVFAVGRPTLTQKGRWMAAILAGAEGALLSHVTAGACYGTSMATGRAIHITIPRRGGHARGGITFHRPRRIHENDIAIHDGFPITSLPKTLLDICATRPTLEAQRVYERAEKLQLLDMLAIHEILDRRRGHRGAAKLRLLSEYDPTAAAQARSELELLFLDLCRRAGIPTPAVNVIVEGFEVDAYWPRAKLVVELDGYEFHAGRAQFERDRLKIATLKRAGIDLVPFTYPQVTRKAAWVEASLHDLLGRSRGSN